MIYIINSMLEFGAARPSGCNGRETEREREMYEFGITSCTGLSQRSQVKSETPNLLRPVLSSNQSRPKGVHG